MPDATTVSTNGHSAAATSPAEVAERFLRRLADGDLDGAAELLAEDVAYTNVSLPTVHGRAVVARLMRATLGRPSARFEVYFHAISHERGVVLTERTDVLAIGPLRMQFWVCGRFEVREGQITVWRDYFDWANFSVAFLRGLAGVLVPPLRARPPR